MIRGIVYDNQKYFHRLLKYEFKGGNSFIFDSFKSVKTFDDLPKKYAFVIFVIYSEAELLDFLKVYKKGIPLIVCSYNKNILKNLINIEEVLLLDASKVRSEIVLDLKAYFNFYNISA